MRVGVVKAVAALSVAGALVAGPAYAAIQLDQASVPETGPVLTIGGGGTALSEGYVLGQSFTVGLTGKLARIDLAVFGTTYDSTPGGYTLSLEQTPGVALASTHFDFADLVDPFLKDWSQAPSFDLSAANVDVTAGEIYRIVLTVDPGAYAHFAGWFETADNVPFAYAGGNAFINGFTVERIDYGFRTYVDTAAVPEPGTWALAILGFGLAGAALRRSQALAQVLD
ncbi:MAG TPA: PEPxxWA-CTERM sorting domain-containing protein [Phenylobacterium sp.]